MESMQAKIKSKRVGSYWESFYEQKWEHDAGALKHMTSLYGQVFNGISKDEKKDILMRLNIWAWDNGMIDNISGVYQFFDYSLQRQNIEGQLDSSWKRKKEMLMLKNRINAVKDELKLRKKVQRDREEDPTCFNEISGTIFRVRVFEDGKGIRNLARLIRTNTPFKGYHDSEVYMEDSSELSEDVGNLEGHLEKLKNKFYSTKYNGKLLGGFRKRIVKFCGGGI